jgi:hypothetical protein
MLNLQGVFSYYVQLAIKFCQIISMESSDTIHINDSKFKAKSVVSDRNDASCFNVHYQRTQ